MVVEVVYSLVVGRLAQAREVAGAWRWNFNHLGEIRANRKALQPLRQMPDREVRRLQVHGSARLSGFLRGQIGRGDDRMRSLRSTGRDLAGSLRRGQLRTSIGVGFAVALVLLVGSRHLVTGSIVSFGDLPRFASSPWRLIQECGSGWRRAGLGSEAPAPTAFALLGILGFLVFGAMSLLRTLLVVGMLPLGAFGMWRLLGPLGSSRSASSASPSTPPSPSRTTRSRAGVGVASSCGPSPPGC